MQRDPAEATVPVEAFRFATKSASLSKPGKDGRRQFSGVAYSGEAINGHWYWGTLVFDISSTKAAASVPALVEHKSDRIAGSGTMSFGKEMLIEGLLSAKTEDAKFVADMADEEFPWQMSVFIEPGEIDQVKAGTKVSVNGREFTGPLTVFRKSQIREVSFCATGADPNTSAQVFTQAEGKSVMTGTATTTAPAAPTIESLQAEVARLTTQFTAMQGERDAALIEAKAFRKERLAQIFKARKEELTDAKAAPFLAMSADAFVATLAFAVVPSTTTTERDPKLFSADEPEGTKPTGAKTSLVEKASKRAKQAA